ncbi:MAG: hypothetical protein COV99_05570 [Bacteroidetes bacterium CG12_big_fil_rev_8_21_14_0_65_60_17]|nr:MAG: hypothetical protein COV99_05570 [Bacteroidetes bacterium CG12_big_fil_rev_8_21_14_0_65_60_17]
MLTNWYTLRALVETWRPPLTGLCLVDAYSQNKATLVLVFGGPDSELFSLTVSLQSPHRHLFLDEGSARARRNVADVFPNALGQQVALLEVADRDRLVYVGFADGSRMVIVPFGPHANVYWCAATGQVDVFLAGRVSPGTDRPEGRSTPSDEPCPPEPRPAPGFETPSEDVLPSLKSVSARLPLFPKPLVREVMARSRHASANRSGEVPTWAEVAAVVREMEVELQEARCTWVYNDGAWPAVLSLARLTHLIPAGSGGHDSAGGQDLDEERLESVSEAVRRVARRRMGLARFRSRYEPLERALISSVRHAERSLSRMDDELQKPSRADTWETFGHVLMAQLHSVPSGADEVELPDIMTGEGTLVIPLKPERDAVRNAEWYYDRARRARESRAHAQSRLCVARQTLEASRELLQELRTVSRTKELDAFEKKHAGRLSRLRGQGRADEARPYRRYTLSDGYEVWVGRNARENDQLTQRDSRPWDLWLHARGVSGSHTVLRLKGRSVTPPAPVIEAAAKIAAWWSKARTSNLAPVAVTERKYVRKPRGAAAGAVAIEREDVLMVEPALPA